MLNTSQRLEGSMKNTSPSNALLLLRDDAYISHATFTAVAAPSASSVLSEQDAECMLAGSSMALHTKYAGMRVSFERELNDAQTRGAGGWRSRSAIAESFWEGLVTLGCTQVKAGGSDESATNQPHSGPQPERPLS